MARAWILLCAGAVFLAHAAPAPPVPTHVKDSKAQEKTIIVRRLPPAFFFPYNLWPMPKFPNKDREVSYSYENFRYKRDVENSSPHKGSSTFLQRRHNER